MDRRSSVASASAHTPLANGHPTQNKVASKGQLPTTRTRSQSTREPIDYTNLEPDELFAKYTVAEVKLVQQRLREQADAKQEELRLMVGERYRDLLQASTSIISIAQSSRRVNEAVEESKAIILSQKEPSLPTHQSSPGSQADKQLRTLQILSAHMKLLLDAPEHLWRLMEKKNYFSSTWLFLLARVVHRALARAEDQDDGGWLSQGIDVLEQFPIVQRQWEAISHFRSQIIHRASMSLRETVVTSEDACGAVLTVHLLDAKPLTETFAIFLSQRSKALHMVLSPSGRLANGNGQISDGIISRKQANAPRGLSMQDVKQKISVVLDCVSSTTKVARETFLDESDRLSLLMQILEHLQSDSLEPPSSGTLPTQLLLSTQALLGNMPSSTHLLLLPPSIRSYKPYVDLSSSATTLSQQQVTQKLKAWFMDSLSSAKTTAEQWFSGLRDVRHVWSVKMFIQKWLHSSDALQDSEATQLADLFASVCHKRVLAIWKQSLVQTQADFKRRLTEAITSIGQGVDVAHLDKQPVEFLFQAPPLPTQALSVSFKEYKANHCLRLESRTTLLNQVLTTLEDCARSLQQDLAHILNVDKVHSRASFDKLQEGYRPEAALFCSDIADTLRLAVDDDDKEFGSNPDCLGFASRVAHTLQRSSPFAADIGCGQESESDFRKQATAIHDRLLERWRAAVVARLVDEYHTQAVSRSQRTPPSPPAPSSQLLRALHALSASIRQLGFEHQGAVDDAFVMFVTDVLRKPTFLQGLETAYDLAYIRRMLKVRPQWENLCTLVDDATEKIASKLPGDQPFPDRAAMESAISESFLRTQTLTALFLHNPPSFVPYPGTEPGDKFAPLLPQGAPSMDKQFQPAFEVANPSTRFGILLVDAPSLR
ncbi:hypothetical protein HGRIS_008221 [Hohenbuehelia grisea]|uniref:Conserved oligomeric Golgi complex subunit 1 n=1 Tax=Hohenbuehelia grisea TaxID=104357 RepID=A0ABR3J7K2_9AGAR